LSHFSSKGAAEWREKYQEDRSKIEMTTTDADRRNDEADLTFCAVF
jgi:hypothetical protein